MLIGYARQSTTHQKSGLEHQIEELTKIGCKKIFAEEISSVASKRPEFENAIEFCREGDTLVVTKLSRFARSITDLWKSVERLNSKKVHFKVLDMNVDTSTATGKLLLNMLGSVYQFERELLLERQMIGIQKNKHKFKGRVPTAERRKAEIQELHRKGMTPSKIAKKLGIGVASVYRYRDSYKDTIDSADEEQKKLLKELSILQKKHDELDKQIPTLKKKHMDKNVSDFELSTIRSAFPLKGTDRLNKLLEINDEQTDELEDESVDVIEMDKERSVYKKKIKEIKNKLNGVSNGR